MDKAAAARTVVVPHMMVVARMVVVVRLTVVARKGVVARWMVTGCMRHVSQRLWPKSFEPKALAADMKCDFRDLHDSTAHPPRIKFLNQYRLLHMHLKCNI